MNKTMRTIGIIAAILVIVGALNWLLVGIFSFNFVTWVSFGMGWIERLLYILVGIAGLYMIVWLVSSKGRMTDCCERNNGRY